MRHSPSTPAHLDTNIRPDGVAAVRRPGIVPRRLLLFGGGVLTGLGLADHNEGLPGAIADALTRRSRRGVDITVVVEPDPLRTQAMDGLRGLRLRRFDAILVILPGAGGGGARMSRGRRELTVQRLASLLDSESAEQAPLFIYDSPSVTSGARHSDSTPAPGEDSEAAAEERPGMASRVRLRELPAPPYLFSPTNPPTAVAYEGWADLIVERLNLETTELQTTLGAEPAPSLTYQKDDETMRQLALRGLELHSDGQPGRLEFIVRQAKATFATSGAALVIVDGDEAQPGPMVGLPIPTTPRENALSNLAIQSDRPTVISDAHRDPRVPVGPIDTGRPDIRFYAAYPVHTWDGYRVGALCIYDQDPRDVSITDLAKLWELAGQIEQVLWSRALRERPSRLRAAPPVPPTSPTGTSGPERRRRRGQPSDARPAQNALAALRLRWMR